MNETEKRLNLSWEDYFREEREKRCRENFKKSRIKETDISTLSNNNTKGQQVVGIDDKNIKSIDIGQTLTIGKTGSGKTSGNLVNQIWLAIKQKMSFVAHDPKGELYVIFKELCEKNGIKTLVFNLGNSNRSNTFNIFHDIYKKAANCRALFINGMKDSINYIAEISELRQLIEDMANMMMPMQPHTNDQTWDAGATKILETGLLRLAEDVIDNNPLMSERKFVLNTFILEINDIISGKMEYINSGEESKTVGKGVLNLPSEKTQWSFFAELKSRLNPFTAPNTLNILNGNDLSEESLLNEPVAIFLITREYDPFDYVLASFIINWVYRTLVEKTDTSPTRRLERGFMFLLDEFGNMPAMEMLASKISLARSRGIFFHLVLQSYAQLDQYNENASNSGVSNNKDTILCNCTRTFFYGSPDYKTKEDFCRECGDMWIVSQEGLLTGDFSNTVRVPCLLPEDIDNLEPFWCYAKIDGKLYKTYTKPYFERPEFKEFKSKSILELLPYNNNLAFDPKNRVDFKSLILNKGRNNRRIPDDDVKYLDEINKKYNLNLVPNPSENDLYHRQNKEREEKLAQRRDAPLFDSVKNILPLMGFSPSDIHKAESLIDDTTKDKRSSVDNDIKNYRLFSASYASEKNIMKLMESIKEKYEPGKCRCILSAIPRIEFYEDEERTFVFYLNVLSKRIEISDKGLTWKSKPYELKNNKQNIEKLRTEFEDAAQKYRLTFDGVEFKTSISLEIALDYPQRVYDRIYDRIERMKRCIHSVDE